MTVVAGQRRAGEARAVSGIALTRAGGTVAVDPGDLEGTLRDALGARECFWLDVVAPGPQEVAVLERVLGLQPVAVVEVKRPSQLPRLEVYPGHALLVVHAVEVHRESRVPVHRAEVDCVLGPTWVVSLHVREVAALREARERWAEGAPFPPAADLVLAGILDRVVQGFYAALDHLADRVAGLEERVMSGKLRNPMGEVTALRRALVRLRHGLGPEQDVLADLAARRSAAAGADRLVSEAGAVVLHQLVDRLRRIWDAVEMERDLVDNVVEVYLGLRTDRLNLIMQRLTLITTIFMPLTLIAGIYGMNFRHMPELGWKYGYPASLALMALVGYGMYRWFRARGWFGEP